jgi:hypothetical protein
LIGVGERTAAGWEKATNERATSDHGGAMDEAVALWKGLGQLPGVSDVISSKITAARLRERSLLTTAGVQYAVAYALHLARAEGIGFHDSTKALAKVNFDPPRMDPAAEKPSEAHPITPDETIFAGNVIDPVTGKVGRAGREGAGEAIYKEIRRTLGR